MHINGPITRYEGETTYLTDGFAFRGEYVQLQDQRYGIGSETPGGLAFFTYPGVGGKAWNLSSTYLLTGEKQPENGTPRVSVRCLVRTLRRAVVDRGWGAWGVGIPLFGNSGNRAGRQPGEPVTRRDSSQPTVIAPTNSRSA